MREIYNEGRVVGLSAYEIYVRQVLSSDPNADVLTEQEWLSAALGANTSMILKVPSGTAAGYHDFVLPEGSDLCGCSIIYGSLFEGAVNVDSSGYWATAVTDYGRLVSNSSSSHPVTPGQPEDVPTKPNPETIPSTYSNQCDEYLKITSALMFQPGQWNLESIPDGRYSLTPDLQERGFIRLAIHEVITQDILILFHGFSYKPLLLTGVINSRTADDRKPENGDFLGPVEFPWACKIVLVATTDMIKDHINKIKTSWSGTRAEFNALTEQEKSRYNLFGIDDTVYNN